MNNLNLQRVVELAVSTRKHGTFNTHALIIKDEDGLKTEVCIFTNDDKLLITSLNGKRIIDEVA